MFELNLEDAPWRPDHQTSRFCVTQTQVAAQPEC